MQNKVNNTLLQNVLQQYFGFSEFLKGQKEALQAIQQNQDVIVIMPTGSGKSLCYQLASLLLKGVTITISPLIALMKDQVDNLINSKVPATLINSTLTAAEMRKRMQDVGAGKYKIVYISPERFRNQRFLESFQSWKVAMIAIDEAHCISHWGHDFRPDYLRLGRILENLPQAQVMALTATATPDVRADIIKQLGLGEGERKPPKLLVYGFARPNLYLKVKKTSDYDEKINCVFAAIKQYKTGIIYCATRKNCERVESLLKKKQHSCLVYHGGLATDIRKQVQDLFMHGKAPVVIATNAFGMGVDRSDIRFIIHWDIPGSIEAYYQEIGRAGRDGKEALCELLYNYADVGTQEFFLAGSNPTQHDVQATWEAVYSRCSQEPVKCSIADWTRSVYTTNNKMTIRTSLSILERAGLIRREILTGERTYTTWLKKDADISALDKQIRNLDEKRRRDENKLKEILRYAHTSTCRHTTILTYFGDHKTSVRCQACDNCSPENIENTRGPVNEDEWQVIQKTLSCISRLNNRYGRKRICQILSGSKAQQILSRNLDESASYGILREQGEYYIRHILKELIRTGTVRVSVGNYPVVSITERGRQVMWKKENISMVWPKNTKSQGTSLSQEDSSLFESLRRWRLHQSQAKKVSAFVILHDKTLKAITAEKPASIEELKLISGIGPDKINKYAAEILKIIPAWKKEHPLNNNSK